MKRLVLAVLFTLLGIGPGLFAQTIVGGGPAYPEAQNFEVYAGVGNNTSVQLALTYACATSWASSGGGEVIINQGVTSGGVSDLASFGSSTTTVTINGCTNVIIRDRRQIPERVYQYSNGTTYAYVVVNYMTWPGAGIPISSGSSSWSSSVATAATTGLLYDTAGTVAFAATLPTAAVPAFTGDVTNSAGSLTTVVGKINGTTIGTNSAADQTIVTTASATGAWTSITNCSGGANALNYSTSTHTFSCNTISAGGVVWSSITNPTASTTFTAPVNDSTLFTYTGGARTTYDMQWTAGADTGSPSTSSFIFNDNTSQTGTGSLVQINTVGSSTQKPVTITAGGTANGVQMNTAGLLAPIGSGGINASQVNSNTFPASSGFTSGGIPYYSSTSAESSSALLTNHGLIVGGGAGAAPAALSVGGANFPLIGQASANPIWSTIAYPTSLTSGGILYGSSTTALSSSGLLAQYGVVVGGGAGNTPATITVDNTATHALFATAGNPAFRAIAATDLTTPSGSSGSVSCTTTCTFPASTNTLFVMTLTQSVTVAPTLTSPVAGAEYAFKWIQDATGGRACLYPSGTVGASPCYTTASHTTYQTFFYDGTNLISEGAATYN